MKVAIVYDWLNQAGGGERVLSAIHRLFPSATIYATVYNPDRAPSEMRGWQIRTSFLQGIPFAARWHQPFLPLMPLAVEELDLSSYDLILSVSSACAKGAIPAPDAKHVCYCFTPCRFIWDQYHEYVRGRLGRVAFAPLAHWLRVWDKVSSDRVDQFVGISTEVAARIRRHYGREAEVIFPPVEVDRVVPNGLDPEDFYLVVARLVPYKRIDLAVEAAKRLGRRLIVVGDGPERRRLEELGGGRVEFTGRLPDAEVADLYARCRGFLFPGWEDFGIAPVEAQSAGRPVVAYRRGGALDTVVEGVTGYFFDEPRVDAIVEAMERLEGTPTDPASCRANAERFGTREFDRDFTAAIDRQLAKQPSVTSSSSEPYIRLAKG